MIESTILKNQPPKHPSYPYLGISGDGNIVLFVEKGEGTLLCKGSNCSYEVGQYYENWHENNFSKLNYPLIMENR